MSLQSHFTSLGPLCLLQCFVDHFGAIVTSHRLMFVMSDQLQLYQSDSDTKRTAKLCPLTPMYCPNVFLPKQRLVETSGYMPLMCPCPIPSTNNATELSVYLTFLGLHVFQSYLVSVDVEHQSTTPGCQLIHVLNIKK